MSIAMPVAEGHQCPGSPYLHPTTSGRVRQEGIKPSDRNYGMVMHLSPLLSMAFGPLIALPLVLWLIRKDESPFVDDHGRELVNLGISFIVIHVILGITVIGLVLAPAYWIVVVVNLIRGAVAANSGEYFRYPVTIRFLS